MMEHRTVQLSRLAMRASRVSLFDMAKQDFARDLHRRGLRFGEIHWHESMESRYECEPFEHIAQVTFYTQVSPGTDPGSSGTEPLTKEQHNA
jgi:hypothetical protein